MILTDAGKIVEFLNRVAEKEVPVVKNRLNLGSFVVLTKFDDKRAYLIDDQKVFEKLPGFDNGLPLETIYHIFTGRTKEREELFEAEGKSSLAYELFLPFSRAVEEEVGGCLERSVLLQLTQQDKRRSFYLSGRGIFPNTRGGHAFNLMEIDGKWQVVDVKQMEPKEDKFKPYVAPLTGFNLATGEIHVDPRFSDGRRYWLGRIGEVKDYLELNLCKRR